MVDDIMALLNHLEAVHDPDIHIYRGQTGHYLHDWVDDGDKKLQLESVYPADYRFITNYHHPHPDLYREVEAARSYGRDVRDQFSIALTLRALSGDPAYAWLEPKTKDFMEHVVSLYGASAGGKQLLELARRSDKDISLFSTSLYRTLWSLAQHYLIATALVDVTFSPRVAAWFATQNWEEKQPAPTTGVGVIYRFHRTGLEEVLEEQTLAMAEWARENNLVRAPALFVVDIRDIPADFARRPTGQQGGSIYGLDQPKVIRAAFERDCIETFEFRHGQKAAVLAEMRHELVPRDDPFTVVADRMHAAFHFLKPEVPSGNADAATYLQRLVNVARLPLLSAKLKQRIPFGPDHAGYHFTDIESTGSHDYAHLLAVVNEKTGGIVAYVSAEPLKGLGGPLPFHCYVLALWINGHRMVLDVAANLGDADSFVERALPVVTKALGLA